MVSWRKVSSGGVLDFDTESRPLTYIGSDFTTAEITAIAAKMVGTRSRPAVWALGELTMEQMLAGFLVLYNQADVVTGHNIIRHDLPRLNAMCLELGWRPLRAKLVCDTYADLRRREGVSGSQESLAKMLGVKSPKVQMDQPSWREANRLTDEGILLTKRRCAADVVQHIALRDELLKRKWLRQPRVWAP